MSSSKGEGEGAPNAADLQNIVGAGFDDDDDDDDIVFVPENDRDSASGQHSWGDVLSEYIPSMPDIDDEEIVVGSTTPPKNGNKDEQSIKSDSEGNSTAPTMQTLSDESSATERSDQVSTVLEDVITVSDGSISKDEATVSESPASSARDASMPTKNGAEDNPPKSQADLTKNDCGKPSDSAAAENQAAATASADKVTPTIEETTKDPPELADKQEVEPTSVNATETNDILEQYQGLLSAAAADSLAENERLRQLLQDTTTEHERLLQQVQGRSDSTEDVDDIDKLQNEIDAISTENAGLLAQIQELENHQQQSATSGGGGGGAAAVQHDEMPRPQPEDQIIGPRNSNRGLTSSMRNHFAQNREAWVQAHSPPPQKKASSFRPSSRSSAEEAQQQPGAARSGSSSTAATQPTTDVEAAGIVASAAPDQQQQAKTEEQAPVGQRRGCRFNPCSSRVRNVVVPAAALLSFIVCVIVLIATW